jgi:hypothetical protein
VKQEQHPISIKELEAYYAGLAPVPIYSSRD